jgi:hypothetical protein
MGDILSGLSRFNYSRPEQAVSLRGKEFGSVLVGLAALALAAASAAAQYPGQVTTGKSAPVLRAVGVFEWTGDEQHPKASRLIPVSVFDGQQLQDGGLYLSQPEPLALESEVEYLLKKDGRNTGVFVVDEAAQVQGSWVGQGTWKPLPKPKPVQTASAQSWKEDDTDNDRPILHRKAHSGTDDSDKSGSGGSGQSSDSGQPTLHRGGDSGSSGSGSDSTAGSNGGSEPAPDPDRPVLHKSADESAGGDSDRPKLQKKNADEEAYVSSLPNISDPDRPRLNPGKPANMGPPVLPTLIGLPPDMNQTVAVSDARNRPEHIWNYSWANPADEAKYKANLEDVARTALGLNAAPAPARPAKKTGTTRRKTRLTLPPPPAPLLDEQFRVFELAYGSGATMVLSAHTAGSGAAEKFVTLIAQPDLYGNLAVLLKSVTDAAHLDDTPRMRLVDAVDAMADNRGELLFELRGQTQRQFALYRVLRGQVAKLFVSSGDAITTTIASQP